MDAILDKVLVLPKESKDAFKACLKEVALPKKHILIRAGRVESDIFFIKKGIVRAFAHSDDLEITFGFFKEGDVVLSLKSYAIGKPGYETMELLEDCIFYQIKQSDLAALFQEDIHIANWGRRFIELELIGVEERLISRQFSTAKERYFDLLKHSPDLLQRVSLGYISSFLGITQVSLSRIRAAWKD